MSVARFKSTHEVAPHSSRRDQIWVEKVFGKIDGEMGDGPDLLDLPGCVPSALRRQLTT